MGILFTGLQIYNYLKKKDQLCNAIVLKFTSIQSILRGIYCTTLFKLYSLITFTDLKKKSKNTIMQSRCQQGLL